MADNTHKKISVNELTTMALMAAVTCVLAPMSIPIGPVPVSLTTLLVVFAVYLLGMKAGTMSYCLYVLLGMVGLPVFSGYAGGLAKLAGPTGGYIIGFIPMALIAGFIMEKVDRKLIQTMLAWALGLVVCYAFGTVWFVQVTGSSVINALTVCVYPFIPVDIAKIIIATLLGRAIRSRLLAAGIYN